MIRLSRTVRFSIEPGQNVPREKPAHGNGHAGWPDAGSIAARYFELTITLGGEVDAASGYLKNIKHIDQGVRSMAVPMLARPLAESAATHGLVSKLFDVLRSTWPNATLESIELHLSPYTSLLAKDTDMLTLRRRYEFSAAHRLHNAELSDEKNRELFGKCNNPLGHGHNYEFEIAVTGEVDIGGQLVDVDALDRVVHERVLIDFDHKHLNAEVADFFTTNPSAEHIAAAIFRRLKPAVPAGVKLSAVKVWETPKTSAEYRDA